MSDSQTSTSVPGAEALASYRDWLGSLTRGSRGIVVVGIFVLLLLVGLSVNKLQSIIGVRPTQFLTWIVVIFVLYTVYGLVRPIVT